jgi:hypothetical protein
MMGITVNQMTDTGKQKVPGGCPALEVQLRIGLVVVVIMIVIVVIPIAIRAPAVSVFIPPAMAMFPTPGAGFRQLMAILGGLRAVPSVMLGGFMEFVIRAGNALLAVIVRA